MSNGGILICRTCKETDSLNWHPKDELDLVMFNNQGWFLDGGEFVQEHKDHELYSYKDAFGGLVGYDFEKGLIIDDDKGYQKLDFNESE